MQTFVPFHQHHASARVLDNKRLNSQINEAKQLIKAISRSAQDPAYRGWSRHPAALMWKQCLPGLRHYHNVMLTEWWERGYARTEGRYTYRPSLCTTELPWWWGGPIHVSHRANLVRKLPSYYSFYFPDADPSLPYVWPGEYP